MSKQRFSREALREVLQACIDGAQSEARELGLRWNGSGVNGLYEPVGYVQVNHKGEEANRIYARWRTALDIAAEFGIGVNSRGNK